MRDLEHVLVALTYALVRIDQDRKHREEKDDDDLGLQIDAKPQDEQWHDRDQGCCIEGVDRQIECPVEPSDARHRDSKRNSDNEGNGQAIDHHFQSLPEKVRQLARYGCCVKGLGNLCWIGKKYRIDEGSNDLPHDEDQQDKAIAK